MCGIAGIYAPGGEADRALVGEMVARMAHRGPDGEGFHSDREIALGMRRLAIVDPEHGEQPLYDERREVACVFNGELYNHLELRRWLEGRGHAFRSGSDGEVIPHLYEELGAAGLVERLDGIFAIAIWDSRERTLHLCRDAFGVKPLYWRQAGGRVAFASELKALLADPAASRELDWAALDHFLALRFVPSPRTLLAEVRKLRPATVLSFGPGGGEPRETEWAAVAPAADRSDRAQLIEEYADAFERAVARQMMSDRPIGVMLSGGVDSGAVCAAMARHSSRVRAFTVGFAGGDERTDETAAARETARLFGAEHESVVVGEAEYVEALPRSLVQLEEPVGTTSALAVNFVAELMKPSVPVALSGQGADEPNAGYGRYLGVKLAQLARAVPGARALAARAPRRLAGRGETLGRGLGVLAAGGDDLAMLMAAWSVLSPAERERLYLPGTLERLRGAEPPEVAAERLRSRVAGLDPLAQILYVDTRFSLPDELLTIADKMSMAASVELRVPCLDPRLVAVAESARSAQRLHRLERKSIHKRAMLRFLPREIVFRRKLGWLAPLDRWLRSELRPLVDEVLLGEGELCRDLLAEQELRRLIDAHARGEADHTRQLFCLLSLGLWHRAFAS